MFDLEFDLYKRAMNAPRPIRRLGNRLVYNAISRGLSLALPPLRDSYEPFNDYNTINSAFLNYGYDDPGFQAQPLALPTLLEASRACIQLYHRVATQTELAGKELLEVGCGRGGGLSWVAGLGPRRAIGVDLASAAIEFCRRVHAAENLTYLVGDAGALPFPAASFDVVLNVESSHCYPSFDAFLAEVRRVLRPGGALCWADVRFDDQLIDTERSFALSGLALVEQQEITANVVAALDSVAPMREQMCRTEVPAPLRPLVRSALAVPGTTVYQALATRRMRYFRKLLRRPADGEAWVDYPFDWSSEDRFDPRRGAQLRRMQRSYDWIARYFRWKYQQPS